MTKEQIEKYLNSFTNFEAMRNRTGLASVSLDRMRELLSALGDPQNKLKIIHVAGSKGKGSTSVYIAHILKRTNLKVGLYTSPHLYDFRERIRVLHKKTKTNGGDIFPDQISWKELADALKKIKPTLDSFKKRITYFEVLTAVALYHFAQKKVDWVVLEVGLGGRLDATNATDGEICVITPISLEHTDILGKTLTAIAKEKIAIVKPTTRLVVVAPQTSQVIKTFESYLKTYKTNTSFVSPKDIACVCVKDFQQTLTLATAKATVSSYSSLLGNHQAQNAACAVKVMEGLNDLGYKIPARAIEEGIKEAFWPGRFEIIQKKNLFILDGAHNEASAQALVETWKNVFPGCKACLMLGMLADKDYQGICRLLDSISNRIILTGIHHPRALDLSQKEIKKFFMTKEISKTKNLSEALKTIAANEIVLIAGSLYLVAESRKLLRG